MQNEAEIDNAEDEEVGLERIGDDVDNLSDPEWVKKGAANISRKCDPGSWRPAASL